ncbi:hypothetical protein [Paragemmobacter ruber]|uniref:Uncharacterized protein n=1 Tax=Paragemmobacter ruber TaxID=1985673 RepID=A0ABW9Y0D7_9RHOB|nr:hypothetical protein [Rhodobacter ruber]NBE05946.1 hypothetical protein [Rhodobacter ruber]
MSDDAQVMLDYDDPQFMQVGNVVWHSSDEDMGPDVGISVGLGDAMLYAGEVPGLAGGWSLVIYPDGSEERLDIAETVEPDEARALIDRLAGVIRSAQAEADRKVDPAQVDALIGAAQPIMAEALASEIEENARLRADLARMERALATAKKAAQDYCWQRFKGRAPLNLSSPAVFTSHEWQKIGEAIDAALSEVPTS